MDSDDKETRLNDGVINNAAPAKRARQGEA